MKELLTPFYLEEWNGREKGGVARLEERGKGRKKRGGRRDGMEKWILKALDTVMSTNGRGSERAITPLLGEEWTGMG